MGDGYAVPRYVKFARQECNETPIGFPANGWGLELNLDTGSPSATHSGLGCPRGDADEILYCFHELQEHITACQERRTDGVSVSGTR